MAQAERRVVLGVSGGIAAYKSVDLVRRLREHGAAVRVVMTEAATQFVAPASFQAVSGEPVRTSLWDEAAEAAMGHIELARWATHLLIAPASADLLARLAQAQADDLLTTLVLASEAPLSLAPAMNQQMWRHAGVQANLRILRERGVRVLGPDSGEQACGDHGPGRMMEPAEIARLLFLAAPLVQPLAGRQVLMTAGPTLEDIDPVRFVGNRSSGRMGFAVAAAAVEMGAKVTLVSGPVSLPTPAGVERVDVRSALQMRDAVMSRADAADVFIAAAAVADYRPAEMLPGKRKKSGEEWMLRLVLNPDILAEVAARSPRPFVVGFAAETDEVEKHARGKLDRKRLDMIAANRVGQDGCGFESCDNALSVYWVDGGQEIPLGPKAEVARALMKLITQRLPR